MEGLKKGRIFISLIVATAIFLLGMIAYSLFRDDDPYKYFSGIGSNFDISPDDKHYLFSYYLGGNENVYIANEDGTEVRKLTNSETERYHDPKYSNDGTKILFLSKNAEGINSLFVANQDGSKQKQLTSNKTHVSEAVFSYSGETIYYIGTPAEEFKKAEGETTEGFDLFAVDINGENIDQLTNKDYFSMNFLSLSPDGKELYYSLFDVNSEKVTSFSLENGLEQDALVARGVPNDSYSFQVSPTGSQMAFTAISEESENSSLFEYELFLRDIEKGQTKRLTDLNSSVTAPRFFHHSNQIAFLENINWPAEPAKFNLNVLDLETDKLKAINIELSNQDSGNWLMKGFDSLVNWKTMSVLYSVLICLFITYLYYYHSKKRSYLPAIISLCLTIIVIISSFVVAFVVDPWFGIGIGMIAAVLIGCTLFVFAYALILNIVGKRNKEKD